MLQIFFYDKVACYFKRRGCISFLNHRSLVIIAIAQDRFNFSKGVVKIAQDIQVKGSITLINSKLVDLLRFLFPSGYDDQQVIYKFGPAFEPYQINLHTTCNVESEKTKRILEAGSGKSAAEKGLVSFNMIQHTDNTLRYINDQQKNKSIMQKIKLKGEKIIFFRKYDDRGKPVDDRVRKVHITGYPNDIMVKKKNIFGYMENLIGENRLL